MKPLVVLAFVCATVALHAQISSPTQFRPQIFDVQQYDVRITFPDPAARTIVADVSIIVDWTASADAPTFPFNLRGLTVDSVYVNSTRAAWTTVGAAEVDTMHHRVTIDHSVKGGLNDTVRVFYHGTMTNEGGSSPWGGVHYQDQVLYALGVGFANNYVSTTQHWLACYDHPSDKATFKGTFIVPNSSPWVVASVGKELPRQTLDTMTVYTWTEQHPIATYLLTFACGPYIFHELPGIDLNAPSNVFYYLPRDKAKSMLSYSLVPQMVYTLSSWFGPFPFDKVGYCNTYKGAMEHQSMISMPVATIQKGDTMCITAAHELAHQWFGDYVTPIDFRYAWLTESFATFSEALWIEKKRGWSTYLKELELKTRNAIAASKQEGVFALEAFPGKPLHRTIRTIYQKGAVVVSMMRAIAGDEAFRSGLQYYLSNSNLKYGNARTEHMADALRPSLGKLTYAFFNEWVLGKGWAKLRVEQRKNGSTTLVTIQQVQQQEFPDWPLFTTLPLNVTFTNLSGNAEDVIMYPDERGVIEFECLELRGVNTGSKSRCMCEVQTISSVDDSNSDESITLAPIPAGDRLIVTRRGTGDREYSMQIVDARGAALRTWTDTTCNSGCVVDVSSYPSGAYVLVMQFGRSVHRLPFTITRGE